MAGFVLSTLARTVMLCGCAAALCISRNHVTFRELSRESCGVAGIDNVGSINCPVLGYAAALLVQRDAAVRLIIRPIPANRDRHELDMLYGWCGQ